MVARPPPMTRTLRCALNTRAFPVHGSTVCHRVLFTSAYVQPTAMLVHYLVFSDTPYRASSPPRRVNDRRVVMRRHLGPGAAPFGHEPNVAVTRALDLRIVC